MLRIFWHNKYFITISIIFGLAIRIYCLYIPPQPYDMTTFAAWGSSVSQVGLAKTYQTIWTDYMPLPMLIFGAIHQASSWIGLSFSLTSRIFWIIVESLLILLIVRNLSPKKKFIGLILWLFPPFIINTALWGQVDSIPALLGLLSLLYLINKAGWRSGFIFALAVALKPIMILMAPVMLALALREHKFFHLLISGLIIMSIGGWHTAYHQATYQAGMYAYTTVNGWNFWSLSGNPWGPKDATSIFQISAHDLGLFLFAIFSFITFSYWKKSNFISNISPLIIGTIFTTFYAFTTRMHERHLMFGLPFLILASLSNPWLILPVGILSLIYSGNMLSAFYWVKHNQTWPIALSTIHFLSWVTVIIVLLLIFWNSLLPKLIVNICRHKLLTAILLFAFFLRIIGLGSIQTMMFDEVYHAFTAKEYIHNNVAAWEWWTTPPPGVAYEWTHPPLAKYGMTLGMLAFGENPFGWRIGSAIMGTLSILGIYLLTNFLTKSSSVALLASFFLSIEGLHLVQSRIAMNDTYMLAFLVWSLYLAVKSRWKGSAILFGLALASKWSAIYGFAPLAIIFFHDQFRPIKLLQAVRCLLIATIIYVLTFIPFLTAGHTYVQLWELHRQMWYYHTHLVATHAYQSTPLQWITVSRPVWYFVHYGENTLANVYAQGNPIILWLGLVALILMLPKILKFPYALNYLLYAIFTLPWLISPRIMFFYHYLPSATFLCVILALWTNSLSSRVRYLIIFFAVIAFIICSPIYFGYDMPKSYWETLYTILPTWK